MNNTILIVAPARTIIGSLAACMLRRKLSMTQNNDFLPTQVRTAFWTNAKLEHGVEALQLEKYDKVYFIGNMLSPDVFNAIDERARDWVLLNQSHGLNKYLEVDKGTVENVGNCEVHALMCDEGIASYIRRNWCEEIKTTEIIDIIEGRGDGDALEYFRAFGKRFNETVWTDFLDNGLTDAHWVRIRAHNDVKSAMCDPESFDIEIGIMDFNGERFDVSLAAMAQRHMASHTARRLAGGVSRCGLPKVGVTFYFRRNMVGLRIRAQDLDVAQAFMRCIGQHDVTCDEQTVVMVTRSEFMTLLGRLTPYA